MCSKWDRGETNGKDGGIDREEMEREWEEGEREREREIVTYCHKLLLQ